jgi:hypothetical protein
MPKASFRTSRASGKTCRPVARRRWACFRTSVLAMRRNSSELRPRLLTACSQRCRQCSGSRTAVRSVGHLMWARHQDKLGSDLEDMGRRRCYTFHELRKHHQLPHLGRHHLRLSLRVFRPEAPESSADARNDKAASQEAPPHCAPLRHTASKHFLVGLFRTPPPGASCRCLLRHAPASDRILNAPRILYINKGYLFSSSGAKIAG